ncbi:cell division protein FtsQ/DivIB [Kitasatospora arboriphila]
MLCVLGALVAGLLGWTVFLSSALDVRAVAVQGLDSGKLGQGEVASALGGLRQGPLARVDLDEARKRVEALPRVAKAEVWRGWPHTLRVKVTERRAVASVRTDDGKFAQVDAGASPSPPRRPPRPECRWWTCSSVSRRTTCWTSSA